MPNVAHRVERRAFVDRENDALGRFVFGAAAYEEVRRRNERTLLAWGRRYVCGCGFSTASPGDIFEHVQQQHKPPLSRVGEQLALSLEAS